MQIPAKQVFPSSKTAMVTLIRTEYVKKKKIIGALFIGIIIIGYVKALKWIFFISTIKVNIEENRVVENL